MMQADELQTMVTEFKTIQDKKVENVRNALKERQQARKDQTAQPVHYPTPSP